jgi:hypothetical protein
MKKIEFALNFGGFYNSIHSSNVDCQIESYYEDGNYPEYEFDNIDFKKTHINYSKDFIDNLNTELDLNLEFTELDSPKFYNFETDKIICLISLKEFKELTTKHLADNNFIDYVNENSKSYDGFMSFYSGIDEVKKEDSILLQYLFQYLLKDIEIEYPYEFNIELINQ